MANGHTALSLTLGGHLYHVDMVEMTQTKRSTGFKRAIREVPCVVPLPSSSTYEWEDDPPNSGDWKPCTPLPPVAYPASLTTSLLTSIAPDAVNTASVHAIQVAVANSQQALTLTMGGHNYDVDLQEMTQTKRTTGFKRAIREVPYVVPQAAVGGNREMADIPWVSAQTTPEAIAAVKACIESEGATLPPAVASNPSAVIDSPAGTTSLPAWLEGVSVDRLRVRVGPQDFPLRVDQRARVEYFLRGDHCEDEWLTGPNAEGRLHFLNYDGTYDRVVLDDEPAGTNRVTLESWNARCAQLRVERTTRNERPLDSTALGPFGLVSVDTAALGLTIQQEAGMYAVDVTRAALENVRAARIRSARLESGSGAVGVLAPMGLIDMSAEERRAGGVPPTAAYIQV